MTDDLLTWLRAQLDEDEEAARDAGGRWRRDLISCVVDATDGGLIVYGEGRPTSEQADHIVRHDPARVLAEVDAKRRILDEHESYSGYGEHCQTCHRLDDLAGDPWPCTTLRLLALPLADRPGYRDEWKP